MPHKYMIATQNKVKVSKEAEKLIKRDFLDVRKSMFKSDNVSH